MEYWKSLRAYVYDSVIVWFTQLWYKSVIERLPQGARVLDIGIGTAAALLNNEALLTEKQLSFVGVDIDLDYIVRAQYLIKAAEKDHCVKVIHQSIYDFTDSVPFDAAYFSGSFMLMPDPKKALLHVINLLKPGSKIYFTQTFEKKKAVLMEYAKPMLQYLTTIDFGQVTYMEPFLAVLQSANCEILEDVELSGNQYRGARLIVVQVAKSSLQE